MYYNTFMGSKNIFPYHQTVSLTRMKSEQFTHCDYTVYMTFWDLLISHGLKRFISIMYRLYNVMVYFLLCNALKIVLEYLKHNKVYDIINDTCITPIVRKHCNIHCN